MNKRQEKQEQNNKLVAPTSWQTVNLMAAEHARKLGRECEELAGKETGYHQKYWMSEAVRHFNRANEYEFHGRA
jgi:hypothetical protein